jgi:hypothetical protein
VQPVPTLRNASKRLQREELHDQGAQVLIQVVTEEAFRFVVVLIPHTFKLATSVKSEVEASIRFDDAADSRKNSAQLRPGHVDQAVHGVYGTKGGRGETKSCHVHHVRDQAPGSAAVDHLRGQIDANDIESVSLEERSVGTGRRPELEQGGVLLLLKELEEAVALRGFPRWSGSHTALLDPAIIGVTEDSRHVVTHRRQM